MPKSATKLGHQQPSHISDRDLDLNPGLDRDGGDLLHDVGWRVKINQALVDAHLPAVEHVCALAARGLAHAEAQDLGRKAHRARNMELLLACPGDKVSAHLL